MDELIQLVMKTYGIAGLIMLSPFVGLVFLWRHYVKTVDKHQTAMETVQNKLHEMSQKRFDDSKALMDKLLQVASEQGALNKETNMALDRVGDLLSIVSTNPALKPR